MKRFLTLAAAVAMTALGSYAELLSPADALGRALGELPTSMRRVRALGAEPVRTVALDSRIPELYVFNSSGELMVVSAESEAPALLGYSENFSAGNALPPALEAMLEAYAMEIAATRSGDVIMAPSVSFREDFETIAPICKTQWNQGAPYNALCPEMRGQKTYTGCVATAMAQVLKVHEYPAKCSGGTFSYYWGQGGKNLSLNFDEITLDWANMLNNYNGTKDPEVSRTAVATLMQAVGYAAQMGYGLEGSGTYGFYLASGLVRNFGIDPTMQYLKRDWFGIGDWTAKVYGELAEGRAVYYDGFTPNNEGHAFVVDGYRGDGFFHLNWGWGGMADGYFLLTALDPESQGIGGAASGNGYDLGQGALFGVKPAGETNTAAPLLFFSQSAFAITSEYAVLGGYANCSYAVYNGGNSTVASVCPALCFTGGDGIKTYTSSSTRNSDIKQYSGFYFGSIPTPKDLSEGAYTVTPAVYDPSTGRYFDAYGPLALGQSVAAFVQGNRIYFKETMLPELSASDMEVPSEIFPNRAFNVTFDLNNDSEVPYSGVLHFALCKVGTTTAKASFPQFAAVLDGGSWQTQTMQLTLQSLTLGTGDFDFILLDSNGKAVSDPVTVTVTSPEDIAELTASGLTAVSLTPDDVSFKVKISCGTGGYKGTVWLQLHNRGDYKDYVARYPIDIELNAGRYTTVTLGGPFPQGIPGMSYTAYIYYTYQGKETECTGRQRKTFTLEDAAIDEIHVGQTENEVYDLSGRRIISPQKGRIYIQNQRKVKL